MRQLAVIGLGSSLGDRRASLELAVRALHATAGVEVDAISRIYASQPLGAARGGFLNAAVRVRNWTISR